MTLADQAPRKDTIRYDTPERELPEGVTVSSDMDDAPEEDDGGLVYNED